MKLAAQLAAAAPLALRGILDCVNVGADCALDEAMEYEAAQFGLVFSTDDMREGTRAFLERRKPEFSGRCAAPAPHRTTHSTRRPLAEKSTPDHREGIPCSPGPSPPPPDRPAP